MHKKIPENIQFNDDFLPYECRFSCPFQSPNLNPVWLGHVFNRNDEKLRKCAVEWSNLGINEGEKRYVNFLLYKSKLHM